MFDIGGMEILLILLVVVVLFGPKKLPELMQGLGRGMREFKKAQRDFTEHINSAFDDEQRSSYRNQERRPARYDPNTVARSAQLASPEPPAEQPPWPAEPPQQFPTQEGTVPRTPPGAAPRTDDPAAERNHSNDQNTQQNTQDS